MKSCIYPELRKGKNILQKKSKKKKKVEKLVCKEFTLLHWLAPLLGSRYSAQHLGCAGEQDRHGLTWSKLRLLKAQSQQGVGSLLGAELLSLTAQEDHVRANYVYTSGNRARRFVVVQTLHRWLDGQPGWGGTGCAGARVPHAQRVSAAHALLGSTLRISESQAQGGERQESAFLTSTQVMFML